jgi:hypothetical protein
MTNIASMRFQSARNPDESGTLYLTENGTLCVEPSAAMVETIAQLEVEAIEKSSLVSWLGVGLLFAAGALAVAAGWYASRKGGSLRDNLLVPRRVEKLRAQYEPQTGLEIDFGRAGATRVTLAWAPGEYDADEATSFMQEFETMQRAQRS